MGDRTSRFFPFFNEAQSRLAWLIGTGLGTGLAPIAPATAGSLAALLVYWATPFDGLSYGLTLMIVAGFPLGGWACGRLIGPGDPAPRRAVWDEFVGMWVTCLLLPKTFPWLWLVAAFCCFRVLDIWKPWPIRKLERLPGGLGIMADDLLAGVYGAVLLNGVRVAMELA